MYAIAWNSLDTLQDVRQTSTLIYARPVSVQPDTGKRLSERAGGTSVDDRAFLILVDLLATWFATCRNGRFLHDCTFSVQVRVGYNSDTLKVLNAFLNPLGGHGMELAVSTRGTQKNRRRLRREVPIEIA